MSHVSALILSCVTLVLLTTVVGTRLFVERIREMRERRIPPQSVSTSRQVAERLQAVQAADNFRNLFEVPVLFYALCAVVVAANLVSASYVIGAWVFVVLRVIHSYIHCTYNRVTHRFAAFALSGLLVVAMWAALGVQLLYARAT